jgi:glycosyltransferase involved in cell wall biosynthesis
VKKAPDLSVVILCYRSEEHLVPFIDEMHAALSGQSIDYELVLVANHDADGHPDSTPQIVKTLANRDARCLPVIETKRGMMGWDLRHGLSAATGSMIAIVDGDGQTPASEIVRLYSLWQQKRPDFLKVYRVQRDDSWFRKFASGLFNFLFAFFFPVWRIRDVNGKPKMFSREAMLRMKLTSNDWFADAEIVLEARRLKFTILETPGISRKNSWRRSFLRAPAIFEFIRNLIGYRIRYWLDR